MYNTMCVYSASCAKCLAAEALHYCTIAGTTIALMQAQGRVRLLLTSEIRCRRACRSVQQPHVACCGA